MNNDFARVLSIVAACLLVFASLFFMAGAIGTASDTVEGETALSADVYVDDDAESGWYNATQVRTVQEGVDNASADDTVYVYNGTYVEQINVTQSLTLRGESNISTVIEGGFNVTADNTTITHFNITNADYYELPQNSGTVGIYINQSKDGFEVALRNNSIDGADYGIYIRDKNEEHGGSATIAGNNITDIEEHAIFFHAHGSYTVEHATVTNNTITDSDKGIKVYACNQSTIDTVTVKGNTFKEEKYDEYDDGHAIRVQAGGGQEADEDGGRIDAVTIDNNTITREEGTDDGQGIRVHSAEESLGVGSVGITNNVVEYPGCQGIRVHLHKNSSKEDAPTEDVDVTVTDNNVTGNENTTTGIRVQAGGCSYEYDESITLGEVIIENNNVTGIGYSEGDDGGHGVRVHSGYYTRIESVKIDNNNVSGEKDTEGHGIRVHSAEESLGVGSVGITNNVVEYPGCQGIRVHLHKNSSKEDAPTEDVDVTVTDNNVTGNENTTTGIRVQAGGCSYEYDESITLGEVIIENNNVTGIGYSEDDEGGHGVRVHSGYYTRIESVKIDNNNVSGEKDTEGHGIRVHSAEESLGVGSVGITNNVVEYPGCQGIRVHLHKNSSKEDAPTEDVDVTVTDNEVIGNEYTKTGIRVQAGGHKYDYDESIMLGEVIIENNNVTGIGYSSESEGGHGVRVHSGYYTRIESVKIDNNTVSGNKDTGGHGIWVHSGYKSFGVGSVDVTDNKVEYPGCQGIRVHLHGNSTEEGVTITDNNVTGDDFTTKGIRVDTSAGVSGHNITLEEVVVENNIVTEINGSGHTVLGIRVHAGGSGEATHMKDVSVIGNEVTDGAGEGIRVQTGGRDEKISTMGRVVVKNNAVTDNEDRGIRVHAGAGGVGAGEGYGDSGTPTGSSIDTAIVEGNIVIDNGVIGLRVSAGDKANVDTATIEDNYVEGHEVGIWDRACGEGIIKSLTIDENQVKRNTEYGILLDDGSWPCPRSGRTNPSGTIESVDVTENTIEDNGAGVCVFDIINDGDTESAVTISYNNISNNTWGIQVQETCEDDIVDNEFWYNGGGSGGTGIAQENGGGNGGAIHLYKANDTYISGNNMTYNYNGIVMEDCEDNLVEDNDIHQTLPDASGENIGVVIMGGESFNVIQHNNVSGYTDGIALVNTGHEEVRYNNVSQNDNGIYLSGSDYNNVTGNDVHDNDGDGIYLDQSDFNNLTANNVWGNDAGIYIRSHSNYNNLTANNAWGNGKGIYMRFYSHYNNLTENYAADNDYGIYLKGHSVGSGDGPTNTTIRDCTASSNAIYDFYATNYTVNTTVTNLTMSSYPTSVDFTYGDGIALKGVDESQVEPFDQHAPLYRYVNVTNVTETSWINVSIHYTDGDLTYTSEDTLDMYEYTASGWASVGGTCDDANDQVWANLSSFSIYGLFGDITQLNLSLYEGWNMVSVPCNQSLNTAGELAELVNGESEGVCTVITRWDTAKQRYVSYIPGSGEGFALSNGTGYFVFVTADVNVNITGDLVTPDVDLSLEEGFNLVGWPYPYDAEASDIAGDIDNCVKVSMFNGSTQTWMAEYIAAVSGTSYDFDVLMADGVFVFVNPGPSGWQPR